MKFVSLEEMIASASVTIRPPLRLTVSEAAQRFRHINNPGAYVGMWDNAIAPYLVEPMDLLSSTSFTGVIFVGPAQSGKTEIGLNWQMHGAICDPADMMIVEKSQAAARDFSRRRIDRLHRHSPESRRLAGTVGSDSVFSKVYTSGMMVTLSWPTINELSGKPIPRLFLTDYDRMPQDVDHEGSPFDLARKRATTFRRYGKTFAESSPGFTVSDAKWIPRTRHEAPPTQDQLTNSGGILSLYNRGDRRRWYWRCPQCRNAFEPDFSLIDYPKTEDVIEAGEQATMVCPHCGWFCYHEPRNGLPGKHDMNRESARWIQDGTLWTPQGAITGTPLRSDIASFWLKGPAAAFADWKTLVVNYLKAMQEFEATGSEEALKTTVMVDQSLPYTPKSQETERRPEELKTRAKDLGQKVVPLGVRFLIASIDVQRKWLQVQVHGYGVGGDIWIVDSYAMRKSRRYDDDGERFFMSPGSHPEDWKQIVQEVMLKTYPLGDGSGREMTIKMTCCDSGGAAGVTANAYNFVRWLRSGPQAGEKEDYGWIPGLAARFILIRGEHKPNQPRTKITFPDTQHKDRHAASRGDVPVLYINSNQIKDAVNHKLDRLEPNGGRITFPNWLPNSFYAELTAEIKTAKGWENPRNIRNEAWDLLCYCEAVCVSALVKADLIRWDNPPGWAEEWDKDNDLVFAPAKEERPFMQTVRANALSLESLAQTLA